MKYKKEISYDLVFFVSISSPIKKKAVLKTIQDTFSNDGFSNCNKVYSIRIQGKIVQASFLLYVRNPSDETRKKAERNVKMPHELEYLISRCCA